MRNGVSRAEMMNLALSQAGQNTILNIDTAKSEQATKINMYWKRAYQHLLTTHPYNFSTKRARLRGLTNTRDNPYNFLYEVPADAWVIWDLYQHESTVYSSAQRAANIARNYYVAPFVGALYFEGGTAEVINGRIASNVTNLQMFYTTNAKILARDYGPYFVEEMINAMSMLVLKDKNVDVNTLGIHSRMNNKQGMMNRKGASNENNKARYIPRSGILRAVDNGIY